jgi:predicted CoA-substrate-specific enzyme activase
VKVCILQSGRLLAHAVGPTGPAADQAARSLLLAALSEASLSPAELHYVVATGYGRRIVPEAHESVSEISANAAGVKWVSADGGVRTIIDVGGQDSKVISLTEEGVVSKFVMNDKCAAGTGRALELIAEAVGVHLDALSEMALQSREACHITSTCAVYIRSEVESLLARGYTKQDVLAGVHRSVAGRIGSLARRVGVVPRVLFDGGAARNAALRWALEEELGVELLVPETPQIVTAIGAAQLAQEKAMQQRRRDAR